MTTSSQVLKVYLLGIPRVEYAGKRIDIPRIQTRALFFRLAADLEPISREKLAFLLWPDVPDAKAQRYLSHRLSLLGHLLPESEALLHSRDFIQLDPDRIWVDTVEFIGLANGLTNSRMIGDLQQAASFYHDRFLEGFVPPKNSEFEGWLEDRRQAYERIYLRVLQALVDNHGMAVTTAEAIVVAQRYLAIDELDEAMHRRLIQLYVIDGDRHAALRQYDRCVSVLRREFEVEPQARRKQCIRVSSGEVIRHRNQTRYGWVGIHIAGCICRFIGREDAVTELRRSYRSARIGQGQFALISGEAGIGKTRLMQDFAQNLEVSEALVLAGSSLRATEMTPYQLIVEALRNRLQQQPDVNSDGAKELVLDERFPNGIPRVWLSEASRLLPELRTLVSNLPEPDATIAREEVRVRLIEALFRLLVAMASPLQTIVVFLDDLQWADRATLSWLVYVAGRIRNQRLLVIGSYRSGEANRLSSFLSDLSRHSMATELVLSGWNEPAIKQTVLHMTNERADADQIESLCRRLHLATQGNPFFVLALLQELAETGQLARDWTTETELPIPDTVRVVLQRRIQRLPPLSRHILETATVLGFRFDFDLVFRTSGTDEMATAEGLEELVPRQFVDAAADAFRFHHELIRETVYKGLDDWRRRLLHRRAATALESLHQHELDEVSAQLAYHFASADQPEPAVRYYQRAAEAALRLGAVYEGLNLLRRGLTLLETLPPGRERDQVELRMQLDLGLSVLMSAESSAPEIGQIYERAEMLATRLGDNYGRFLALDGLFDYCTRASDRARSRKIAEEQLALARKLGDPMANGRALLRSAMELYSAGELDSALREIEQVRNLVRQHTEPAAYHHHAYAKLQPVICMVHGMILQLLGYSKQASTEFCEAIRLSGHDNPYAALIICETYARINMEQCEVEEALARLSEIDRIEKRFGLPYARSHCHFTEGWIAAQQGQIDQGIARARQAIDKLKELKRMRDILLYECLLAQLYLQAERYEEGLALVDDALASADQLIQRPAECELLRLKGELLAASGADASDVEQYLRSAVEMARAQHARIFELKAIMSLNRLWQTTGNAQQQNEGHRLLAHAYAWFTEGLDTNNLKQAKAMLDGHQRQAAQL